MEQPLISVIVPVYRVEQYLDRCVQSLLSQTYPALEIILVDDGSPDGCPALCDQYAEKYPQVKAVHRENGGLSAARNTGLQHASGQYIAFVDSDDWLTEDAYAYAMGLMQEQGADCVHFGFVKAAAPREISQPEEKIDVYSGKDILQYYMDFSTRTGSYSVWKGLFSRALLEGVRFREGKINEDIDYHYRVLQGSRCLAVSNQYKYVYFQSGDSLSTGGLKKRDFDLYEAAEALWQMTEQEDYGSIRFLGRVKKARTPFSFLCKMAYYGVADQDIDEKALVKRLKKEHRKHAAILLRAPLSLARKGLAMGFCVSYHFTKAVIRLGKRWISV